MKRAFFGGIAVMVGLAVNTAQAQYGTTQPTLLPNYPSTSNAYPLNNGQTQPSRPVSYPRQDIAPGPQGEQAVVNDGAAAQAVVQNNGVQAPAASYSDGCNTGCGTAYAGGYGGVYNQAGCGNNAVYGGNYGGAYGNAYNSVVGPQLGGGAGCGVAPAFGGAVAAGGNANRVFGIRGLIFSRDYEDDVNLSFNPTSQLFSTDADVDAMPGVEGYFGSRNCNGWGWEGRYWGLFPSQSDVTFTGAALYTALPTINYVDFGGFNVQQSFDNATSHRIYRDDEIHNLEFNLMRNAGCATGFLGRSINVELLAGIRYFKYDESFRYSAFGTGAYPPELHYDLDVENELVGFQLGVRTETCLSQRLRFNCGTKFGLYDNSIYHRQTITDGNLNFGVINTGNYATQAYNVASNKSEIAFLGELDLGLAYEISCRSRVSIGYRAVAVSGIAHAPSQIPSNFQDLLEAGRINSNDSLILHGAYAGLDICF